MHQEKRELINKLRELDKLIKSDYVPFNKCRDILNKMNVLINRFEKKVNPDYYEK